MPIFAIPKNYLPLVTIDFSSTVADLPIVQEMVKPKLTFCTEEFMELLKPTGQELLVCEDLKTAKLLALLLSRVYSGEYKDRNTGKDIISKQIKQFASVVIFRFDDIGVDNSKSLQTIDPETLGEYPNFASNPFYVSRGPYYEKMYARDVLNAFKSDPTLSVPKFRRYAICARPNAVIFQNVAGEFRTVPVTAEIHNIDEARRKSTPRSRL